MCIVTPSPYVLRNHPTMLKKIAAFLSCMLLSLGLSGCVSSSSAGLQSYIDNIDGYGFLYPIGWIQVELTQEGGPDVVFHDIINPTENVSVVINAVPDGQSLDDLGSPTEVGYSLQQNALAPEGSGRTAELVDAQERNAGESKFYMLEYKVHLPDQDRHDVASVVVHRGQLYTINASTTERRWNRMKDIMQNIVTSFSVT